MAKEFFNNQESNTCTSSPSTSFRDFEEEWSKIAEESFDSVFESGNSPDDPHIEKEVPTGLKRKLSETEDSLILTKRKMSKAIPFQQQADEEDEILKKFRKDNFTKYEALERRTLGNSPTSPISITSSPASTSNSASPINISTCSFQFPPTPLEFNSVFNLPAPDHILKPNTNTTVPPAAVLPGTSTSNQTLGEYPLKGELNALRELTDSVRKDLIQTSMLANHIHDYLKCLNLPAPGYTATPNTNTTVPPPAVLPGTSTSNQTLGKYPLKGELNALCELTDSVRVDLLQTSILVHYIQDCLKCSKIFSNV